MIPVWLKPIWNQGVYQDAQTELEQDYRGSISLESVPSKHIMLLQHHLTLLQCFLTLSQPSNNLMSLVGR